MTIFIMTLLVLFSAGLCLAGIQLFRFQRQLASQQNILRKLASELNATTSGNYGLGNRMLSMQKQLASLKTQYQDVISANSIGQYQKQSYKQASHLAKMGASIDELRQSCELSQGEAELLTHMKLN